jgi:hypothetical protein
VSEGVPVHLINLSSLGEEDLYGNVASKVEFAGYGDATDLEIVVADITFKNQVFPSEGSFDTSDDLGPVPYEHYYFA